MSNRNKDDILKMVGAVAPLAGVAAGAAIGASMGSVVPVVGTAIGALVGAFVGWGIGWLFGDNNFLKVRIYYAGIIQTFTGVLTYYEEDDGVMIQALSSKQGAVQALNLMLNRYIDIAHLAYSAKVLPSFHKEAATEFYKLKGYAQMLVNNEEAISSTNNTVNTLGEIKKAIDDLNIRLETNQVTEEQYETDLKPHINAFGRLSANMINGDDIASADNLLKQIVDERTYIYRDLLKGPLGCEKDLEQNKQNLATHLHATTRMNYPFPILYTYNMPAGGNIPDPFPEISGLDPNTPNRTNPSATHTYGPGFLSFYSFQKDGRYYKNCVDVAATSWCELHLEDVVPMDNNKLRNLGAIGIPNRDPGGPFEHTIGVY